MSQKLTAAGSACEVVGGVSWASYAFAVGVSGFVLAMVLLTLPGTVPPLIA